VTPAQLALRHAQARIIEQLEQLEPRLAECDLAAWVQYAQLAAALAAIVRETAPGAGGRLLSTAELADALGVSPKTILRKRRSGELTAIELGRRGRSALRWQGDQVAR
jgi:excisionase family DNA binding protein